MRWRRNVVPWMIVGMVIPASMLAPACQPGSRQCPNSLLVCPHPLVCNTAGTECTDSHCGNGITEPELYEVCDKGDTQPGDGCSADCRSLEGCGNGKLDLGELCEDGNKSDEDWCVSEYCLPASCGDGFVRSVTR